VREFLRERLGPVPGLFGNRTILGIMPDWNPAEIIGVCPRPLALSLYRSLVTDESWCAARSRIGYRPLGSTPLVVALAGRPYVDVRASLNSFLPADLEPRIAERAVEDGIEYLARHPHLHDKIEFEVIPTCLDLEMGAWTRRWSDAGWDPASIAAYLASLRTLTERMVRGDVGSPAEYLEEIGVLGRRDERWLVPAPRGMAGRMSTAMGLLSDCRDWGIVPFAVLARRRLGGVGAGLDAQGAAGGRRRHAGSDEEQESTHSRIPHVAIVAAG
jgi:hypothetical protein